MDEDFEKELAALMSDFKLPPSGPFPQAVAADNTAESSKDDDRGTVSFRVMMKRGGRDDRSKAVQVVPPCCVCYSGCLQFHQPVASACV